MKTIIHFPINQQVKLKIELGDKIEKGEEIGEEILEAEENIIPIASLLHIKPNAIFSFLLKKKGEEISAGEIIARKKGLLSTFFVKSPFSGKIKEIDLKKGTISVSNFLKKKKIILPVKGKVKDISKNFLEVEIEGEVYRAVKGRGKETVGKLKYFADETIDIFHVSSEVEGEIILCKKIPEEVLVKLDVLGAVGVISEKTIMSSETEFSWMEVNEEVFKKLSVQAKKIVWLRPEEKEIVVLE